MNLQAISAVADGALVAVTFQGCTALSLPRFVVRSSLASSPEARILAAVVKRLLFIAAFSRAARAMVARETLKLGVTYNAVERDSTAALPAFLVVALARATLLMEQAAGNIEFFAARYTGFIPAGFRSGHKEIIP